MVIWGTVFFFFNEEIHSKKFCNILFNPMSSHTPPSVKKGKWKNVKSALSRDTPYVFSAFVFE